MEIGVRSVSIILTARKDAIMSCLVLHLSLVLSEIHRRWSVELEMIIKRVCP